ncbi:hypothetical protein Tcan_09242 [Toxocara canis]|uniref:Uncharacterized protein n=1 Tax=Toxocara canis TaxID=6265 RepID=A0A0B2VSU0_TOXCA|nr:hypothetical protein Tcan_09242 [Toxocara canis]
MSVSAYFTIEPSDSNNEPNDTTVTIIRLCDNTAVINADDTSSTPTTTGTFVLDDGAGDESDNTVSYNLATKVVNDSKNVLANSDEVGDEDTSNLDASVSASVVLFTLLDENWQKTDDMRKKKNSKKIAKDD